jgi:hypothetical protein
VLADATAPGDADVVFTARWRSNNRPLPEASTKLWKVPVDSYRRLVLDPKSKAIKHGQNATEEISSRNSDLNQPDNPTDKSMEISAERKADLVSDPNYPSFEILLDVAGKLLDAFDKH